jgi:lipooligosaccharide transport system permease protein
MALTIQQGARRLVNVPKVRRTGAWYVAEARIRQMLKWKSTIIAYSVANPVLYLTAIGIGVGTLVDANTGDAGVGGVSYLVFLAPALLATAAITGAVDEAMFPTLEGFKWRKLFYAMNATPLTGHQIAHGVLIAAVVRTTVATIIYWFILRLFGAIPSGTSWLLIPLAILAGASLAAIMIAVTSYIYDDDGYFAIVQRLVIMPLFLFSGTFYPLSQMPWFLQWIGWISPLWHATELGRWFSYGHVIPGWLILVHFAVLVVLLVVGIVHGGRRFTVRLAE